MVSCYVQAQDLGTKSENAHECIRECSEYGEDCYLGKRPKLENATGVVRHR